LIGGAAGTVDGPVRYAPVTASVWPPEVHVGGQCVYFEMLCSVTFDTVFDSLLARLLCFKSGLVLNANS